MQRLQAEAHTRLLNLAAYRAVMLKAQAAFTASDFTNAVALAGDAAKKIPGDADAARLRGRAQKNLDDYHQAVNEANTAFTNANFIAAQDSAGTALSFYANDAAMQRLKAEAEGRYRSQKAYVDAMKNAQTALDRRNYTNAVSFANIALTKVPNERSAIRLRDEAQKFLDDYHASVAKALVAYQSADYLAAGTNADQALTIYANDPAMQQIKANALNKLSNLKAYEIELASAQTALDHHEFTQAISSANSALKKVPNALGASNIKNQAQQSLNSLNEFASQAQAAYGIENYAAALALTDKVLALQSQHTAIQQLRSNILRRLDGKLASLLGSFGVATPTELKYAEINAQPKLGPIGETGKPYYLSQLKTLEKTYRAGNWLDENQRQTLINSLTNIISGWE